MLRARSVLGCSPGGLLGRRPLADARILRLRQAPLALHFGELRALRGGGGLGGLAELRLRVGLGAGGLLGAAPVLVSAAPRRGLVLVPAARARLGLLRGAAQADAIRQGRHGRRTGALLTCAAASDEYSASTTRSPASSSVDRRSPCSDSQNAWSAERDVSDDGGGSRPLAPSSSGFFPDARMPAKSARSGRAARARRATRGAEPSAAHTRKARQRAKLAAATDAPAWSHRARGGWGLCGSAGGHARTRGPPPPAHLHDAVLDVRPEARLAEAGLRSLARRGIRAAQELGEAREGGRRRCGTNKRGCRGDVLGVLERAAWPRRCECERVQFGGRGCGSSGSAGAGSLGRRETDSSLWPCRSLRGHGDGDRDGNAAVHVRIVGRGRPAAGTSEIDGGKAKARKQRRRKLAPPPTFPRFAIPRVVGQ